MCIGHLHFWRPSCAQYALTSSLSYGNHFQTIPSAPKVFRLLDRWHDCWGYVSVLNFQLTREWWRITCQGGLSRCLTLLFHSIITSSCNFNLFRLLFVSCCICVNIHDWPLAFHLKSQNQNRGQDSPEANNPGSTAFQEVFYWEHRRGRNREGAPCSEAWVVVTSSMDTAAKLPLWSSSSSLQGFCFEM